MDCRILREITIKSDGHICCDDSNGYDINLGLISEKNGWNIRKVLDGPIYRHVRDAFDRGEAPWGDTCKGCDLFHNVGQPVDTLSSKISLRIEPTLACDLRCAFCKRQREANSRSGDWDLSLDKLRSFLKSCKSNRIDIEMVSYLGWGEPLNHQKFPEMVHLVRELNPTALQEVTTIANAEFAVAIGDAPIDRIIISCDGVAQPSYEKYRVNGNIERVFEFMRQSARRKSDHTKIIWKYILFQHNDSDEDVSWAQRFAEECALDEIHFILTNTKNGSRRFTLENIQDFPMISKIARVLPAAALQRVEASFVERVFNRSLNSAHTVGYVDTLVRTNGGMLACDGWVMHPSGGHVYCILARLNDGKYAEVTRQTRIDVRDNVPGAISGDCGFSILIPYPESACGVTLSILVFADQQREPAEFQFSVGGAPKTG